MNLQLDILAFAAHPDDVELSCSGTIIKMVNAGKKVGIVDLTQGELGTRGSAELRVVEAKKSSEIMGLQMRENLGLADGFFEINNENKIKVIEQIRRFKPQIVIANSLTDRHIDHGRGAKLVADAAFLSGLRKVETHWNGEQQEAWRPKIVLHYIQDRYMEPSFIVDISNEWETKLKSIKAFSSQFYDPNSTEPKTPISGEDFFDFLKGRAKEFGRLIGVEYGEGFVCERPIGINDLTLLS